MMTPERWAQLKEIFTHISEQPPEAQPQALAQACQGDAELEKELAWLLAQDKETGGFLDTGGGIQSPTNRLQPGELLANRYEVVALLGSGGMGEVYEAEDRELGERMALKVIDPQQSLDRKTLDRLRREVLLARRVTHANVCRVFGLERHRANDGPEIIFLTMELIRGETLGQRLEKIGRFDAAQALPIAVQLCQALAAAHHAGILHRDFKPANVMLAGSGEAPRAVVMDFGIARWMHHRDDGSQVLTSANAVFGTPAYMSPEQLQGKELTAASDIYSLGLVLYEMVTGVRPFRAESGWSEAMKRLSEDPSPPIQLVPGLPPNWNTTIVRCLERDPSRRLASADEVAESLQGVIRRPRRRSLPKSSIIVATLGLLACTTLAVTFQERLFRASLPAQKHVAVFPMIFAQSDPANQQYANGISESLTGDLARLETDGGPLWVVPWAEMQGQKREDSGRAAASLGVNLLVFGAIEKNGVGLRFHIVLMDAKTRRQLASQTIDVPEPEIPTVEDKLLVQVAGMLQIQAPRTMLHGLPSGKTALPGAYALYQRGQGYMQQPDEQDLDRAIELLENAIQLDPNFAPAYASLGQAKVAKFSYSKDVKLLEEARHACARALALDDGLAKAHLANGMVLQASGDVKLAIAEYDKAGTLDPSDEATSRKLASAYDEMGRTPDAVRVMDRAIQRNNASWLNYNLLGFIYYKQAQYDQAEPLFLAASKLAPENPAPLANLAAVYLSEGKYEEAKSLLIRVVNVKPSADAYSNLGTAYYYLKSYSDAIAAFRSATGLRAKDHRMWHSLGDAYEAAGDRAAAAHAFERAIMELKPQLALNPHDADLLEYLAYYDAKLGRMMEARTNLAQALLHPANTHDFLFNTAHLYELTGQREKALHYIGLAIRADHPLSDIETDSDLEALRADPRFAQILATEAPTRISK